MTAMEPPNSFDADAVRAKKAEVIEANLKRRVTEIAIRFSEAI